MDWRLPGSSVHGILLARHWSGLPCPPPGDLPDPGIKPVSLASPASSGRFFTPELPGSPGLSGGRVPRIPAVTMKSARAASDQVCRAQPSRHKGCSRRTHSSGNPKLALSSLFPLWDGFAKFAAGLYPLSSWPWMGLVSGRPLMRALDCHWRRRWQQEGLGPQEPEKEGARVAVRGCHPLRGVLGSLFYRLLCLMTLNLNGTRSPNAWVQIPSLSPAGCVATVNYSFFLSFLVCKMRMVTEISSPVF